MCDRVVFLKAFDQVAGILRGMKAYAMEIQSQGDIRADVPVARMWSPQHDVTAAAASSVVVPFGAQAAAAELTKRFLLWKRMAEQARDAEATEVNLHVLEIWEPWDEQALLKYEAVRARLTGEQGLFPLGEAV